MRRFELHRDVDPSGVSGTGVVAEGVVFTDGTAVMRWVGTLATTVVADSLGDIVCIHGHNGKTRVVFLDYARDGTR